MPTLLRKFNFGSKEREQNTELYNQLSTMHEDTANIVNTKSSKHVVASDPISTPLTSPVNRSYDIGDVWVRTDTNTAWIMTSRVSAESVTWTLIT